MCKCHVPDRRHCAEKEPNVTSSQSSRTSEKVRIILEEKKIEGKPQESMTRSVSPQEQSREENKSFKHSQERKDETKKGKDEDKRKAKDQDNSDRHSQERKVEDHAKKKTNSKGAGKNKLRRAKVKKEKVKTWTRLARRESLKSSWNYFWNDIFICAAILSFWSLVITL